MDAGRSHSRPLWCEAVRMDEGLEALLADVERVRGDEELVRRARVLLDRDRELFERLAEGSADDRT